MQFGPQSPSNGQVGEAPNPGMPALKFRWWCARNEAAQASEKMKAARMSTKQLN
jgi:hypothetical protein